MRTRSAHRSFRVATVLAAIGAVLAVAGTAVASVPMTTVSTDPYTNPSSFHQTQVEPDNFAFASTIVNVFQSGRFANGGASNTGWATSTDNGKTWTHGFLPGTTVLATPAGPWSRISDPTVAYDARHHVWMAAGLAIDATVTGKAVLVNRSTDGGLTWQNPVTVSQGGARAFYDKDWIVCDDWAASPFFGSCYAQWDLASSNNRVLMSRSTDGGLTWTASTIPNSSVIAGQPLVQPNGTVIMPIDNGVETRVESFVSADGGATYTGPFTVSSLQVHPVAGGMRTDALPSADVDASGHVYVVWQDCRFRTGCSANDLVMSTSTDGMTWTPTVRIPATSAAGSADLFLPGVGVDHHTAGATAHLGVAFYLYPDASCTASTCRLFGAFLSSRDGGATWSAPRILVGPITLPSLPLTSLGYMVGDYISTAVAGGRAFPVLEDAQPGTCTQGQITSCHEFTVVPAHGLVITGGSNGVGRESSSVRPARRGPNRTAF